jgi:hypothetical protein
MQIEAERDYSPRLLYQEKAGKSNRTPTKKGGNFIPPFKFKAKF